MTFISYAQNFEDVMLRRALKDIEIGFYIDVGANDPVNDSVTKAFYDTGWRGINIEPVSEWYNNLQQHRPDDINLQLAVGSRKGQLNFYEIVGTGMSTMDESIAKQHVQKHGFELKNYKIPVVTLTTICEQHPHSDIHFLKIDVEGTEQSVLQGLNLKKIRPWIILVESTLPNKQIENYEEWEHLLTERGYHYTYFDGLNRYYVADEHDELDAAFIVPPNYFDHFKRAREYWLEHHNARLLNERNSARDSLNQIKENADRVETTLQDTEQQRQQLEAQVQTLQAEAGQRDERLREKETKLQEVTATLTDNKQQIDKLHTSLADNIEQRHALETTLQDTKQQRQQMETQVQTLHAEAGQRHKRLREKETKLQEVTVTLTDNKQQIDKLHASLADSIEQQHALETTLQDTEQQRQQLETQMQTLHAEADQLGKQLHDKEKSINWLNNKWDAAKTRLEELTGILATTRAKIDELNHSSHHWWLEADQLRKELLAVYGSKSWRITWPLRKLMQLLTRLFPLLARIVLWFVRLPKRSMRWLLTKAITFTLRRHKLKLKTTNWLLKHPRQYARLKLFAQAHGLTGRIPTSQPAPKQRLQSPSIQGLAVTENKAFMMGAAEALPLPMPSGKRRIYVFVDHTINCPTCTGVQRVTRGLAVSLSRLGESVRYVKWDDVKNQCVLINLSERERLAHWNGPAIEEFELDIYPSTDKITVPVVQHVLGENHWLIVPEVPHITYHEYPLTLDVLQWSRRAGLKSGFIFYDAIPLQREEFREMAPRHAKYMQQLLLADVVWPISQWSADDLVAFLVSNNCANSKTLPEIVVIPLPGESHLCNRIQKPQFEKTFFLSIGSIEQRKNQVKLIKAFQEYRNRHSDSAWELILVGNLHPDVAKEVNRAVRSDTSIKHFGHVSDHELDILYRTCAFTVFPSVIEGFGLPIIESLWYGKPCVCANFGAMAEVADSGGCYMVDTRDQTILGEAITRLIEDDEFRHTLAMQAVSRPITSWENYGAAICAHVENEGQPQTRLGRVYYWIDSTLQFCKNTGIQRVSRQLARCLIDMGIALVPVKWDVSQARFGPVGSEELEFFSKWNGPDASLWQDWVEPDPQRKHDCFLMPDLPLNRSTAERAQLLDYVHKEGLRCVAIFYDAIPWKMRDIYPAHFVQAHREYMTGLAEYDRVMPISTFTQEDLIDFLGASLPRPQGLDARIKATVLPGEFPESPRVTNITPRAEGPITILCVGTVEPRKNHETLLQAFELAALRTNEPLRLVIAGGSHSIEPELADRVRAFVERHSGVTWEEDADDARLRELHLSCDFTIYPSIEEGFGLPILESIWYAKPCICANFGAMQEAAEGGGCLMVDVRSAEAVAGAIQRMAEDSTLRKTMALEAVKRPLKSWQDYAREVLAQLVEASPRPSHITELPLDKLEIEVRAKAMNLAPRPKLSICISTYNRAEWLSTSLKNWSRLCPTPRQNVELLVCDNASTDHTQKVVKPYLERVDFTYHRNTHNVGMLGNLRETAHHACGEYIWIIGDDDLLLPGAIERLIDALQSHPNVPLVYLNYSFTRIEDARTITDFDTFFQEATPIIPPEPDLEGPINAICARNENFFTAIYTLVFRRDHAIKAYSQDTSGRPFSTMLTCIPTTYYVLNYMMDELGVWIGEPQVVVNMNVSWLKYAPIWILERIPAVYEIAEERGVPADQMDQWRRHTLPGVVHYIKVIFEDDQLDNAAYFKLDRLVRRFKHLPEFASFYSELREVYSSAHSKSHPAAIKPVSAVFPEN